MIQYLSCHRKILVGGTDKQRFVLIAADVS